MIRDLIRAVLSSEWSWCRRVGVVGHAVIDHRCLVGRVDGDLQGHRNRAIVGGGGSGRVGWHEEDVSCARVAGVENEGVVGSGVGREQKTCELLSR